MSGDPIICLPLVFDGCLIRILPDQGAMLLHASGVTRNGKLWLFSGPSGVGKTTIATRLNGKGAPFSLDRVALCVDDSGSVTVWPTPFSDPDNIAGNPGPWPLHGVVFVEQALEPRLLELNVLDASKRLLRNTLIAVRRQEADAKLLVTAERIARTGRCVALQFSEDEGFWPLLDQWSPAWGGVSEGVS